MAHDLLVPDLLLCHYFLVTFGKKKIEHVCLLVHIHSEKIDVELQDKSTTKKSHHGTKCREAVYHTWEFHRCCKYKG